MFENADHSNDIVQQLKKSKLSRNYFLTQHFVCFKTLITQIIQPSGPDMDKVQAVFKQFVREWSKDGEEERMMAYQPIIDEIEARLQPGPEG